jgi:hypothetical protein
MKAWYLGKLRANMPRWSPLSRLGKGPWSQQQEIRTNTECSKLVHLSLLLAGTSSTGKQRGTYCRSAPREHLFGGGRFLQSHQVFPPANEAVSGPQREWSNLA